MQVPTITSPIPVNVVPCPTSTTTILSILLSGIIIILSIQLYIKYVQTKYLLYERDYLIMQIQLIQQSITDSQSTNSLSMNNSLQATQGTTMSVPNHGSGSHQVKLNTQGTA
jgi:hypothetical protein